MNWYNDNEPYVVDWLTNLIEAGHIAPGVVDGRSIKEITPDDVAGKTQCHFFAGIGGWSHALRLAGWPDDRPVWTGSCPCQPFSVAGKRGGTDDPRHLWPEWFRLIRECKPGVIFGEQVASKDGLGWLDIVCADLEGAGYAVAAYDLCAAGAGAPHLRQRLWFVASLGENATRLGRRGRRDGNKRRDIGALQAAGHSATDFVADANVSGLSFRQREKLPGAEQQQKGRTTEQRGRASFWSDAEWIYCRDGKYRPTKPGVFPLADGIPGRVAKLRAIGNAIVPQVAAEFIRAYMTAPALKTVGT